MIRENMLDVLGSEPKIRLLGIVTSETLKKVSKGLPALDDKNIRCFFASYSTFDIEINKKFDIIFDEDNPKNAFHHCQTELYGVTQQFGKSFQEIGIPKGWKTIVAIKFLDKIPTIVDEMPLLETWFEKKTEKGVILSSNRFYNLYCTEFINQNNIEEQ